jgi:hypothetical protein
VHGIQTRTAPASPCAWHAVTYYSSIIAWALFYFGASFKWPFPWAAENCGQDPACQANPARALPIARSDDYLLTDVMQFNEANVAKGVADLFSGPLIGCTPPPRHPAGAVVHACVQALLPYLQP